MGVIQANPGFMVLQLDTRKKQFVFGHRLLPGQVRESSRVPAKSNALFDKSVEYELRFFRQAGAQWKVGRENTFTHEFGSRKLGHVVVAFGLNHLIPVLSVCWTIAVKFEFTEDTFVKFRRHLDFKVARLNSK
jgi:hypothetical protein